MPREGRNRGLTVAQIRRLKKDASVSLHMPQSIKDQLVKLAELERAGLGAGEYIVENLVIPYLVKLEVETKARQKIFNLTENE